MQIGMIGLGRMGANMVRRLQAQGHHCVVYDRDTRAATALAETGAQTAADLSALCEQLDAPRTVWLMLPAAVVDNTIDQLTPLLSAGDVIIDGGNSMYRDDIRRAASLSEHGLHYLDIGVSGGVHGLKRGYCLMIGGEPDVVTRLEPVFLSLAPGLGSIPRTAPRRGDPTPAELGYLHCGGAGAGHFVKMVHNGIEYGIMAAYAEGLNILKHANSGATTRSADAETAPLNNPTDYQYNLDLADIAEVWRRGSVIGSWLLDLTANALNDPQQFAKFSGRVSDSGEGRWTSIAAIETGTPAPVLTTALYQRFSSRGEAQFADQVLSAMRHGFGGHNEK